MRRLLHTVVVGIGLLTGFGRCASAQSSPPTGVRAAGMGGAFTAMADDATATVWNPAGLASGPYAGLTLDRNALDQGSGLFAGISTPPLGISYFRAVVPASSTGGAASDRHGAVENRVLQSAGVTLVQSLGDHGIAAGATVKIVHASGASRIDADLGLMAAGSLGKIGLTVHDVAAPSLGDVQLQRRVRAGVSVSVHPAVTVAGDLELTTTDSPLGRWRDAAVGVEAHPYARAWVRSGLHWNTTGSEAAAVGSVGGSYALYGSFRADLQWTFGSEAGNRGWGVGLSFAY